MSTYRRGPRGGWKSGFGGRHTEQAIIEFVWSPQGWKQVFGSVDDGILVFSTHPSKTIMVLRKEV